MNKVISVQEERSLSQLGIKNNDVISYIVINYKDESEEPSEEDFMGNEYTLNMDYEHAFFHNNIENSTQLNSDIPSIDAIMNTLNNLYEYSEYY